MYTLFVFRSATQRQQAYAILLLSYACVSLKPVLSRHLLLEGWTPLSLYVLILVITVIIMGVHEFASLDLKKSWTFYKKDFLGMLISSLTGGILVPILTFEALTEATATRAVLIQSLSPVFVVIFAMIFLGERLRLNSSLGIILLITGLCILLSNEIMHFSLTRSSTLLLIAAVIGPFSVISHKKYVKHRHLDSIVFMKTTFSLVVVGTWMLISEPESAQIFTQAQNLWVILGLSVLGFIIPYMLYYRALKNIKAFEAGILSLFSPVFTIILAGWILGESIETREVLSLFVMMIGILLINVPLTKWRIVPSRLLWMGPLGK